MAEAQVMTLTDSNFKDDVLDNTTPVLVDFWAAWCGPCRMVAPVIEEVAAEYAGRLRVGKVNVDENRQLAMDYGVMSIPTMIIFKDGKPAERVVGYQSKQQLSSLLAKHF
ncbi:MAG TPA: thioredoxin [Bacillota bacterium]|nr:thioredoxin [Bacillota bacterium]